MIDQAAFQLKCCLDLCTQLLKVPISEEAIQVGDFVLIRTANGCILKPYNTVGFESLTWHTNYTTLNTDRPQPVGADAIAAVRNSQGVSWLPGYKPKGYYRSTGTAWEFFGDFSVQSSQIDTDAGLVTDQFVSPFTLANYIKWVTKQDSIQFKDEGVYLGSAGTVNEIDFTGAGVVATRAGNKITLLITGSPFTDGDYGDITISGGGTVFTIDNGLSATVIGDGSVSNTEFQYINSLSSNAQDQINTKMDTNLGIAMAVAL